MKYSRFNYILKCGDQNVAYNTLSRRLLLLDTTLVKLYTTAVEANDVNKIENNHPSFYQKLIEDKFIIEDKTDETEEVRKIMHEIDQDETQYYLVINPTMNCNFKCWYCYESHIKESRMTEQTIKHIVEHIRSILDKNKKIKRVDIGWFGGEPLLYFDNIMLPIMQEANKVTKEYGVIFMQNMTTNGFLLKEHMISCFKEFNLSSFQITLDGNRVLHNTVRFVSKNRGSYDDIVANIKLLVRNKLTVTARVNYTKATLEDIENIYEDFKDLSKDDLKYFNINFHQIWQVKDKTLNDRVDKLVRFFRTRGIKCKNSFVPDALFNSCYADKKNHATINYDGNVFKCTARNFSKDNREGILKENGEIKWNEKFYNRMEIKLKNRPCQSCKILPLCNGGCSQVAIEADGKDFCVYDYDENVKRDIVYRKVENILMDRIEDLAN